MQSCEGAQKELKAPHSGVTEHSSNTPFVIEDNSGDPWNPSQSCGSMHSSLSRNLINVSVKQLLKQALSLQCEQRC